ncbi:MAG: serine hydroxymethyltransferase [Candidatus Paceibacterota bacterium]
MEYKNLKTEDKEIYEAVVGERERQAKTLNLIASENYTSQAVHEATASRLAEKYAEGYPGRRYYSGQKFADQVESLAIERAKELFGAKYANVQPLSGAPANLAVYFALLEPGDTVLGMDLSHGGHLTHGHPVTLPAHVFNFVRYGMKDVTTGEIDYDALREVAKKEQPKIILAGFSAYSRELDYKKFKKIADEVGAISMMDAAHIAGLIAGGALANPLEVGFDVMTCTTHKTLRGPRGGLILSQDEETAAKINKAVFPGLQGGPHMNSIAAKAVAFREAATEEFASYAKKVIANAQAMAEVFTDQKATIIAGGTDNHLMLIDVVESFGIGGDKAQETLEAVGITLNKNAIPDDERSPMDPAGVRIGTPAITTRGFDEEASRELAGLICTLLADPENEALQAQTAEKVATLAAAHPIPNSFV